MWEQELIDYYAEGYTLRYIESVTGVSIQAQKHMMRRLEIPIPLYPNQTDYPRLMSDAEMLRGGEITDRHMAVSDRRTRDAEREVAATLRWVANG